MYGIPDYVSSNNFPQLFSKFFESVCADLAINQKIKLLKKQYA